MVCILVKHNIEASCQDRGGLFFCDPPSFPLIFFHNPPFWRAQKTLTLPRFPPPPPSPLLISDKSLILFLYYYYPVFRLSLDAAAITQQNDILTSTLSDFIRFLPVVT